MRGAPRVARAALIGCGHIGGSLALALKEAGICDEVVGFDAVPLAAARAKALGLCDSVAATDVEAVSEADLVLLAIPVRSMAAVAARIAGALRRSAIVTDVGSTKAGVVAACEGAMPGARFVGGHPLAGTERSGPGSASAKLFIGKRVVLTPTARTDAAALSFVTRLWQSVGASSVVEIDPAVHDHVLAAVSHLPHAAAYALAGALAARGTDDLPGLTGGGFADTTRVAATLPAMWVDVFLENRAEVLPLLDGLADRVAALRSAIAAGDAGALEALLAEARAARERILGG